MPHSEKVGDTVNVSDTVRVAESLAEFVASRVPEGDPDPLSDVVPDPDTEGVNMLLDEALGEEENDTVAVVVDELVGEADPLLEALLLPVAKDVEVADTLALNELVPHAEKEPEWEPDEESKAESVARLLDEALGEEEIGRAHV